MMQHTGNWLTRQLDDVRFKLERSDQVSRVPDHADLHTARKDW